MNFAPFTSHIPASAGVPTIHQFAAKFGYENTNTVLQETRYQGGGVQFAVSPASVSVADGKFRHDSVVVVSAAPAHAMPAHTVNAGVKYQTITQASSSVNVGNIAYGHTYVPHETVLKTEQRDNIIMQHHVTQVPTQQGTQQLVLVLHEPKEAVSLARAIKQEGARGDEHTAPAEYISIGDVSEWQSLGGGVADYLSALPLPLHHLLKYSCDKEPTIVTVNANATQPVSANIQANVNSLVVQTATIVNQTTLNSNTVNTITVPRRKKKKKSVKEKKPKPKPGEIRLTTALDGSTLYCCPECHMAYPERGLLEQHLVGHTMERRFICDICNAALKRKDHLTRHKQSHNPQRPHVCAVCQKAFKRKEQLTLHFVIHSGEKRHVCSECGKGFYRKDHLRKHTRSHIARRVKAELSQQHARADPLPSAVPAPTAVPAPAPLPAHKHS